jgi:hypothetical protein
MAKIFSGSYSSGITLSNPSYNPATVTGTISLATGGIALQAASAWSVFNSGRIISSYGYGVELTAGGYVRNRASGRIRGRTAVGISGAAGTVVNAGNITSSNGEAIYLKSGGLVTNVASASINAANGEGFGVNIAGAAGTLLNSGHINGEVGLLSGGSVTNAASGTIISYIHAVILSTAGTVVNYGVNRRSRNDKQFAWRDEGRRRFDRWRGSQ